MLTLVSQFDGQERTVSYLSFRTCGLFIGGKDASAVRADGSRRSAGTWVVGLPSTAALLIAIALGRCAARGGSTTKSGAGRRPKTR